MLAIMGTVKGGQIVFDEPLALPEGTVVDVSPRQSIPGKIGLDPSEWRDDETAMADWAAWIASFEPLESTPEEEADLARFRAAMKQHNVEAVRKQMEGGEG